MRIASLLRDEVHPLLAVAALAGAAAAGAVVAQNVHCVTVKDIHVVDIDQTDLKDATIAPRLYVRLGFHDRLSFQ